MVLTFAQFVAARPQQRIDLVQAGVAFGAPAAIGEARRAAAGAQRLGQRVASARRQQLATSAAHFVPLFLDSPLYRAWQGRGAAAETCT